MKVVLKVLIRLCRYTVFSVCIYLKWHLFMWHASTIVPLNCYQFLSPENYINLHLKNTCNYIPCKLEAKTNTSFIKRTGYIYNKMVLTLLLLIMTSPVLANSVDPDQLASEEANWSGSALFVIKYVNFYQKPRSKNLIGWKLEVGMAF